MCETKKTVERGTFVTAMRSVASAVSVVTTNGPAGRHGATVSAFCSVSADPPTVLVCLNAASRIARLVDENQVFSVNILPLDAPKIAERFAGAHDQEVTDRFDGIEIEGGTAPAITGATVLECRLCQSVVAGSHRIFIGQVAAIYGRINRPLTYLEGAYHQVRPLSATVE